MRTMGLRNLSFRRNSKNPAELYLVRTLGGIVLNDARHLQARGRRSSQRLHPNAHLAAMRAAMMIE
ncbi:MAG TPA: hypothetical protein VJV22_11265 [Acidobacteriaceae bacterium]|nr:hypothetical protein [Acidobacteriaceae bacterium]